MRTTTRGDRIEVDLIHDFVRCALTHDAVADPVFERHDLPTLGQPLFVTKDNVSEFKPGWGSTSG